MAIFYTVDRKGDLKEGLEIRLEQYHDIDPICLQQHVDELFPEGFSSHGERYFLRNDSKASISSPAIEILFEYVRRALYPDRPSRFQSLFAFQSKKAAVEFRTQYGEDSHSIWEVESEKFFIADMSLLTIRDSILVYSYLAHQYWKGKSHPKQKTVWEVVLHLPVRVVKKIA